MNIGTVNKVYLPSALVTPRALQHAFIALCSAVSYDGLLYSGAVKSLARTGRKQATATEDFVFHLSYL
jgi:hypothetical protein